MVIAGAALFLFAACDQPEPLILDAPQNKYIVCRGSALYLNNGQKWKANKETTIGIDKMIAQIDALPEDADTADYHKLANDLLQDYIYIVNYCEVMGNNHEMVHAFLNPIQDLIVPLQISGLETCQTQVPKLKEFLLRYHEYFE